MSRSTASHILHVLYIAKTTCIVCAVRFFWHYNHTYITILVIDSILFLWVFFSHRCLEGLTKFFLLYINLFLAEGFVPVGQTYQKCTIKPSVTPVTWKNAPSWAPGTGFSRNSVRSSWKYICYTEGGHDLCFRLQSPPLGLPGNTVSISRNTLSCLSEHTHFFVLWFVTGFTPTTALSTLFGCGLFWLRLTLTFLTVDVPNPIIVYCFSVDASSVVLLLPLAPPLKLGFVCKQRTATCRMGGVWVM